MDNNTNANPRNGGTNMTSAEPHVGEQLLPNDTMNRTAERICTQKITIPTLAKQDCTNANMWWRKFLQYVKMKGLEVKIQLKEDAKLIQQKGRPILIHL